MAPDDAPKLSVYLNLDNLVDLRADTIWPGLEGLARYQTSDGRRLRGRATHTNDPPLAGAPMPHCGLDRINTPAEADTIAARHADRGDRCLTVHVGWGLEDDNEVFHLVEAVLDASDKASSADLYRNASRDDHSGRVADCADHEENFPRFASTATSATTTAAWNSSMAIGPTKLDFMEPIFDESRLHAWPHRQSWLHPGIHRCQFRSGVRTGQRHSSYLDHFKELWTRAMLGFLRNAVPGDVLIFAPELLASTHFYARLIPDASGQLVEESDRYSQALIYKDLARIMLC